MLIGRKITVVGGGIGGLTAALALAKRGAQVTVLEQSESIREVGAGIQVSPNGAAVLRALGLEGEVAACSPRAKGVYLRDYRKGGEVVHLDLTDGDGTYYFVHRADLLEILARAAREAGVKIRLLQKILDVDVQDDGVLMTTVQGARSAADLVVGADGLHSVVRRAVNGPQKPFFTRQVAWRAIVPVEEPAAPVATVHMGPGCHLVHYPLRDGRHVNIVGVQERMLWADEGWFHEDDPANLRAAFADFAPEVQALLSKIDTVHLWGLFRHPVAPKWHKGAAVILGDAAHPTLPFMAQGANMALEDAWVLAAMLSIHDTPQTAFTAYQEARRDRCEKIVHAANRNARNYHLSFPPLRVAVHGALKLGSTLMPERMIGRFDWIYGYNAPEIFRG